MSHRYIIFFLMIVLVATACKRRDNSNYSKVHSEAGIKRPKFSSIHKDLMALEQKYASRVDLITYGQSAGGRPLLALKITSSKDKIKSPKKAVILTEAIHGNEYLNITDRLAEIFAERSGQMSSISTFINAGGLIYMIPVYNPDGFIAGERVNGNHVDLNRDFALPSKSNDGSSQPETKAFLSFVASEAKKENFSLELFMEYHCCIGGLIHPWTHTDKQPSKDEMKVLREVGEISKKTFGYPYGNAWDIVSYNALGTSIDYFQETFMRRAFSFEGEFEKEDKKLQKHVAMYDELFPLL